LDTDPPDVITTVDVPTTVTLDSSITIAGTTHNITGETVIYVQPSQMSADEISFNMKNIQLRAATITNQPYTVSNGTVTLGSPREADATDANTALLAGIGATSNYPRGWHKNSGGTLIPQTAAVANLTADACTKLIAAAGTNTKVYVIKYGSNTTAAALDSCGPSGKIEVYAASNESDLNARLQDIADDIKSFAGYSGTQVGENIP
jgi:hypothetical protein